LHELTKCPTSPQRKQVAFDGSATGAREVRKPGVSRLSASGGSNRMGSGEYLGAGSIPGRAAVLLGFTTAEVGGWRRCVLSMGGNWR